MLLTTTIERREVQSDHRVSKKRILVHATFGLFNCPEHVYKSANAAKDSSRHLFTIKGGVDLLERYKVSAKKKLMQKKTE